MTQERKEGSAYTRRTVVRATVGGLAAGLAATPAAAGGKGKGKGKGSDPVIDSLDVYDSDGCVLADYDVSDADGDLDRVGIVVYNRPNKTLASDTDDISGDQASGTLETGALEPGTYDWAFAVIDEKKNATKRTGTITVE